MAPDQKISDGVIMWKTAANIWSTWTTMLEEASTSKNPLIRCRAPNSPKNCGDPKGTPAILNPVQVVLVG